ncbi:MAG TPA: type II toxin-antitoxin system RatA family toxin [Patescibacteria group bacterium]|nr:type II toxin-antitoxin system RatA family toxin [Patescibacteria group bacterium]
MPKVSDTRIIDVPRKELFRLLMDMEHYPEFIPFVRAARILAREGHETLAEIGIGLGTIGFNYKCRVTDKAHEEIDIVAVEGPFRYLRARLTFEDAGPGRTKVGYFFDSQFRSRTMNAIADPVFNIHLKSTLASVEKFILRRRSRK